MNEMYSLTLTHSLVGELKIITSSKCLVAIAWGHEDLQRIQLKDNFVKESSFYAENVLKQLDEYFSGKRQIFELALNFQGTEFQQAVWQALSHIPYGKTVSYAQIAEIVGKPKAVRAVGTAIGKNPFSIVVPCHRVIGTNGKLRGFAGGLEVKATLLGHEKLYTSV